MATILIHGDTIRYPAMRHEVPLEIMDPFLLVEHEGRAHVLTNPLEDARLAEVLPDAEIVLEGDLGMTDDPVATDAQYAREEE